MLDASFIALMADQEKFFKAFTKMAVDDLPAKFGPGTKPYLHVMELADGSQVSIKFIDAIKERRDAKFKIVPGKESLMSGYEISVKPKTSKAYAKVFNLGKVLVTPAKIDCTAKHQAKLDNLRGIASQFGIDLSTPESWVNVYRDPRKTQ
jgi:hypothetical protein